MAHRRLLGHEGVVVLLLGVLLLGLAPAQADEEGAWHRVELPGGPFVVSVPATWRAAPRSPGHPLLVRAPGGEDLGLVAWAVPTDGQPALDAFVAEQIAVAAGATIDDVGFRIEQTHQAEAGGLPAVWTLVARPGVRPPLRSLYVHWLDDHRGYALRIDVPLAAYAELRDVVLRIARSVERAPTPEADADASADGPGEGHEVFDREVPEALSFRGHTFIQIVEAAARKRTFGPAERRALEVANEAWARTEDHVRRLTADRRYRAADQAFSSATTHPRHRSQALAYHWIEPYAVVWVGRELAPVWDLLLEGPVMALERAVGAETRRQQALASRGRTLADTYHRFLEAYGEPLGLRHLLEPYGGRPLDPPGLRSYADGHPLVVYIHAVGEEELADSGLPALRWRDGTLHVAESPADPVRDAVGAVHQLLHAFTRQRRMWRAHPPSDDALLEGFPSWFGAIRLTEGGDVVHTGVHPRRLRGLQQAAASLAREGRHGLPVFGLRETIRVQRASVATQRMAEAFGLDAPSARDLWEDQAWAFVHFLANRAGGASRARIADLLRASIDGQMAIGGADVVFARVLGVQSEDDWLALEREWRAHVEALLAADPQPLPEEGQLPVGR